MNKKLIVGLGILGLAALGFLAFKNKGKNSADSKAQADAAEKKRQEDLARINDPERKKLYDDIYLAIVEKIKNLPENDGGKEIILPDGSKAETIVEIVANANQSAYRQYESLLPTFNKMSIAELKVLLEVAKNPNEINKDAFKFREWADLVTKFPILES